MTGVTDGEDCLFESHLRRVPFRADVHQLTGETSSTGSRINAMPSRLRENSRRVTISLELGLPETAGFIRRMGLMVTWPRRVPKWREEQTILHKWEKHGKCVKNGINLRDEFMSGISKSPLRPPPTSESTPHLFAFLLWFIKHSLWSGEMNYE